MEQLFKMNESRQVPLQFLVELNQFLQSNFPMAQVRQAVTILESFIEPPKEESNA